MNQKIREQFPMLKNDLVYLDSGALVQKHINVINAELDFYTKYCVSNRTSDSKLGIYTNNIVNETRELCAKLLECNADQIILNSGTTEGLNYSSLLLKDFINENDEILISQYNHSSNIIPWVEIAKEKKAKIVFSSNLINDINNKTKIICFSQLTNNFTENINIKELYQKAKKFSAFLINDAAQAISHEKVSAKYSDIIAFSGNKLFASTGIGVLYVSYDILNNANSKKFGGGAIAKLEKDGSWTSKNSIIKHEPGTLNLAGIFGLNAALKWFLSLDLKEIKQYLYSLSSYAYEKINQLPNAKVVSKKGDAIILIEFENISSQDVASYLGHRDIYVRSGVFCAQYLKHIVNNPLIRLSIHIYSNKEDIDKFVKEVKKGGDFLDFV